MVKTKTSLISSYADKYFAEELVGLQPIKTIGSLVTGSKSVIMVRNVDDLDFCLSSHSQSILEGLRSLCSHPNLVDVTLSAGGRDFPCHRGILAVCSLYFHSMFSSDFVESIATRIELHDVDPDVLAALLDFAYTGKLTINQGNVEGLICTSSQLQFQTVRAVCSRYLQNQIDASNCLGIQEFGEIHGCPEVVAKAKAYLLENFEAVQQHEEFLLLEKDKLFACLKDEGLQVRNDCARAEAALAWVRHCRDSRICHLPELLRLARLPHLPESYLMEILLKDALVQDSPECKELLEVVSREVGYLFVCYKYQAHIVQNITWPISVCLVKSKYVESFVSEK